MKFLLGIVLGAGAGVAATILLSNRSEEEGLVQSVQTSAQQALASAKAAIIPREKELRREFHERVPSPDRPTLG